MFVSRSQTAFFSLLGDGKKVTFPTPPQKKSIGLAMQDYLYVTTSTKEVTLMVQLMLAANCVVCMYCKCSISAVV